MPMSHRDKENERMNRKRDSAEGNVKVARCAQVLPTRGLCLFRDNRLLKDSHKIIDFHGSLR